MEEKIFKPGAASRVIYIVGAVFLWMIATGYLDFAGIKCYHQKWRLVWVILLYIGSFVPMYLKM